MITVRGQTITIKDPGDTGAPDVGEVLDRLEKVTVRSDGQWSASCPAHDDQNPSLSIRQAKDRILLHCHAGCSYEEIVEALGLTSNDLRARRVVDRYVYTDESGAPLSFKLRYQPKGFTQGRWGKDPDPIYDLKGVRPVLYRLADLREAVSNGERVYVVDGEKDVHAIEWVGGVATTAPGNRWLPEFSEFLRAAVVTIVADRDEAGRKKTRQQYDALRAIAGSVTVVEAVAGNDAADHLAAGYGLDDFVPVRWSLDEAQSHRASAPDGRHIIVTLFSDIEERPVDWLWPGVVPFGKLMLLIGDPGHGKSLITTDLAARMSFGRDMPDGTPCSPAMALMTFLEDAPEDTVKPRLRVAGANQERVGYVQMVTKEGFDDLLSFPDDVERLHQRVKDLQARLLSVDPLTAFLGSNVNAWRDHDVRRAIGPLQQMAEDTGCAVVGVVHLNKRSGTPALYRALNSIAFTASARSVFLVGPHPDDATSADQRKVLVHIKGNISGPVPARTFKLVADAGEVVPRIEWGEEVDLTSDDVLGSGKSANKSRQLDRAIALIEKELANGPRAARDLYDIAEAQGISQRTVRNAGKAVGVHTKKGGFGEAGWIWSLSADDGDNTH